MTGRDEYYNRAKQEGYRSRSAYKLRQLDEQVGLLDRGDAVVDLGAAPGGWLQVAAESVGSGGRVLGVDRQRIDPIEGGEDEAPVETIRGDLTEAATRERIRERVGEADVVLSDMAPQMTGEYGVDHARSVHLARQAAETAAEILVGGGALVVKVFDGPDVDDLRADLNRSYTRVGTVVPEASRDASSELYLVCTGRLTAPVRAGDERTVEIGDLGDEGDGIATVDGFTLFVPGTEVGERVDVRVTDVKPRFGFAERID